MGEKKEDNKSNAIVLYTYYYCHQPLLFNFRLKILDRAVYNAYVNQSIKI